MSDGVRRSKRLRRTSSRVAEQDSPLQSLNTPPRRARGRPRRAGRVDRAATSSNKATAVDQKQEEEEASEPDNADEAAASIATDESLDTNEEPSTDELGSSQPDNPTNDPSTLSETATTTQADSFNEAADADLIASSDNAESVEDASTNDQTVSLENSMTNEENSFDQDTVTALEDALDAEDNTEENIIPDAVDTAQNEQEDEISNAVEVTDVITVLSSEEEADEDPAAENHDTQAPTNDNDDPRSPDNASQNGGEAPFIHSCRSFLEIMDPHYHLTFENALYHLRSSNQLEHDVDARYKLRSIFESLTDGEKAELVIGQVMQIQKLHESNDTLQGQVDQQRKDLADAVRTIGDLSDHISNAAQQPATLYPIPEVGEDPPVASVKSKKKPQGSRFFRIKFDSLFSRKRKQDADDDDDEDEEEDGLAAGSASKKFKVTPSTQSLREERSSTSNIAPQISRFAPMMSGAIPDASASRSRSREGGNITDEETNDSTKSRATSQPGTPSALANSYLGSLFGSVSRIFNAGSLTAPPKASSSTILTSTPHEPKSSQYLDPDVAISSVEKADNFEGIDRHSPTFLRQQRNLPATAGQASRPRRFHFFSMDPDFSKPLNAGTADDDDVFSAQPNPFDPKNVTKEHESFSARYSVPSNEDSATPHRPFLSRYQSGKAMASEPQRRTRTSRSDHRLRSTASNIKEDVLNGDADFRVEGNDGPAFEKLRRAVATAQASATKKIEDKQQVGQKRKTRTDDVKVIPSGPAGTFSMIDTFFEVDSSDEEDSVSLSIIEAADEEPLSFKKRRSDTGVIARIELPSIRNKDVNSTPVFGSPSKQGGFVEKSRAQPYDGRIFTDPTPSVYHGENVFALNEKREAKNKTSLGEDSLAAMAHGKSFGVWTGKSAAAIGRSENFDNHEGTFSVPDDTDSEGSSMISTNSDSPTPSRPDGSSLAQSTPAVTSSSSTVDEGSNNSPSKKSVIFASPIEMGPSTDYHNPRESESHHTTDSYDSPAVLGDGTLGSNKIDRGAGTSENSEALAKARSNAEKYKPKRPSTLRAATGPYIASGDSSIGTGLAVTSTDGNNANSDQPLDSETDSPLDANTSGSAYPIESTPNVVSSVEPSTTPPPEDNSPSSGSEDEFAWPEPGPRLDPDMTQEEETEWNKWAAVPANLEAYWGEVMKNYEEQVATGTEIDYGV